MHKRNQGIMYCEPNQWLLTFALAPRILPFPITTASCWFGERNHVLDSGMNLRSLLQYALSNNQRYQFGDDFYIFYLFIFCTNLHLLHDPTEISPSQAPLSELERSSS